MNFSIESIYKWYRDLLQNPKYRWWVVGASILYLVSPIDFLPDIFPVVGWIDDAAVIGLLVAEMSQLVKTKLEEKSVRTNNSNSNPQDNKTVDVEAVNLES
jgi:uncharacterized membrane protein YkvA (DUF1232 family)